MYEVLKMSFGHTLCPLLKKKKTFETLYEQLSIHAHNPVIHPGTVIYCHNNPCDVHVHVAYY